MGRKICKIDLELVPIEEDGFHLMVKAKIGRKHIRLLVDTGASKTVFDKNRLTDIIGNANFETVEHLSTGLGTNTMESQIAEIKSFRLGSVVIKDSPVVVMDLSHVNLSYDMIGDKGIDGVLGSDFLEYFKAVIYYHKPMLKLYY